MAIMNGAPLAGPTSEPGRAAPGGGTSSHLHLRPDWPSVLWVVEEYLPQIGLLERSRFSSLDEAVGALCAHTVVPFAIPHDFTDGYQPAFWRRPEAYLDPVVRAASSTFASLPDTVVEPAMARLRQDLRSGLWHERHQDLIEAQAIDYCYRLLVAG